jgi:hypothetical protein
MARVSRSFDGVASGGVLPFLAIEPGDMEDDLRDLPLRRRGSRRSIAASCAIAGAVAPSAACPAGSLGHEGSPAGGARIDAIESVPT